MISGMDDAGSDRFPLAGELDLAVVPALEARLDAWCREQEGAEVVLDCRELTFIDSSGIGMLFRVAQGLQDRRRTLVLEDVPRTAQRVFDVVGLEKTIEVRRANG
jgi:anti-anti-sigma factor